VLPTKVPRSSTTAIPLRLYLAMMRKVSNALVRSLTGMTGLLPSFRSDSCQPMMNMGRPRHRYRQQTCLSELIITVSSQRSNIDRQAIHTPSFTLSCISFASRLRYTSDMERLSICAKETIRRLQKR